MPRPFGTEPPEIEEATAAHLSTFGYASDRAGAAPDRLRPLGSTRTDTAQSPRRLRGVAVAGADFPNVDVARLAVPDRLGGLGSHTRRSLNRPSKQEME